MATVKQDTLNAAECKAIHFALCMSLASKKRALNAPTTSDEMKIVLQREMSDLQALAIRFM